MTELQEHGKGDGKTVSDVVEENRKNIQHYREVLYGADEAKGKRDVENEAVAEAKKKREESNAKFEEMKKELAEKEKTAAGIGETGNFYGLQRDLERTEWLLQTEATSPKKEKEMSKRAKEIREELGKSKKAYALRQEVHVLRERLADMATEAKAAHLAVVLHAKESDAMHTKMLKLRGEAETLSKSISENLEKIPPAERPSMNESQERRAPPRERRQERPIQVTQPKSGDLNEEADRVLERFKKGEKISSEEIQLLQTTGKL